jgi:hypothetical protein
MTQAMVEGGDGRHRDAGAHKKPGSEMVLPGRAFKIAEL